MGPQPPRAAATSRRSRVVSDATAGESAPESQNRTAGVLFREGVPAGESDKNGDYPAGTVHHAVKKRLEELALELKDYGEHAREHSDKPDGDQSPD